MDKVGRWNEEDEYHLNHESMSWIGVAGSEIDELCLNQDHLIAKKGSELRGQKGKDSAMK